VTVVARLPTGSEHASAIMLHQMGEMSAQLRELAA
jgi:hypothetical protein